MIKILTNGDIQCFLDYHPSISTDEYFELLSSLSHEERLSLCLSNKFSKAERNRQ
jgi:hypothetical protein